MRFPVVSTLCVLFIAIWIQERNHFAAIDIFFPPFYVNTTVEEHFAENYYQARATFRQRATEAGAKLHNLPLNHLAHLDLTIDVAVIEGSKDRVLLHMSGTHGVEGFAGSAVQSALLQRTKQWKRAQGPTVVFVHALNPYGFAMLRRYNENNVDLNRNFLSSKEFQAEMARDSNEHGYVDIYHFLNPTIQATWKNWFWPKGAYYIATVGYNALKKALVSGNYHFPTSSFFGGQKKQPSLVLLEQFLKENVNMPALTRFGMIDVHTGLGPSGVDTLLLVEGTEPRIVDRVFAEEQKAGRTEIHRSSDSENAVMSGYSTAKGFINAGISKLISPQCLKNSLVLVQEFGTVPSIMVAKAMIQENAYYHHAPGRRLPYAEKLRDVFYVHESFSWKQCVLERGLEVFGKLYNHLALPTIDQDLHHK